MNTAINPSPRRSIIRTVSQGEHSNTESLVRMPSPSKQPPPEILLEIFKFALPPPVFLDASITAGPSSPWCLAQRIKKNIVLVCKLWCQTGTSLLYRDVHLRRIGHVAALFNTLQGNSRLGIMIKTIDVSCYIIPQCSVMFHEALRRILEMSPTVTRLSLNMSVWASPTMSTCKYDLSRIVHLEVGEAFFLDVLPCLAQCKNLVILSIEAFRDTTDANTPLSLTLEHLQELHILRKSSSFDLEILCVAAQKWIMPRLRCFTLHHVRFIGDETPGYFSFFDTHGKNLTTLSITTSPMDNLTFRITDIQMFLDLCLALEHLAVCSPASNDWEVYLSHKSLRWIDVWAPPSQDLTYPPDFSALDWAQVQEFPQLQDIRVFDRALLTAAGPRIHLFIPPSSVQYHETLEWRFPGIDVLYDEGHIQRGHGVCDVFHRCL